MSNNKDTGAFSSPTLTYMTRIRSWPGGRRGSGTGSGAPPQVNVRGSNNAEQLQSILQGMRAVARPNGEPRRSVLEILDDAIALEDSFQRNHRSSAPRRGRSGPAPGDHDGSKQ